MRHRLPNLVLAMFCCVGTLCAEPPRPPSALDVKDVDNDDGTKLDLSWEISPDDNGRKEGNPVIGYRLERRANPPEPLPEGKEREHIIIRGEFREVAVLDPGTSSYVDQKLSHESAYFYRLSALGADDAVSAPEISPQPVSPIRQWFDTRKGWFGVFLIVVCGSVVIFIRLAQSGMDLRIRKVAGLEAVEEAVGRATEMGRDCLFIPGIQDINDIQTVAGLIILNRVAEYTAEYDAGLQVPTTRSLVMTMAQETVAGAYLKAGRPELYNADKIYYLTDEQFGFVAGVTGTMVREKPAACFYMGSFYAESLIFAETGNSIGAIQIAGTAQPSQLPFFIAACDYVLIGEEFFAASAYLSGEPKQLGSLKGQDVGKLIGGALILAGAVLLTLVSLGEHQEINETVLNGLRSSSLWLKEVFLRTSF